MKTTKIVSLLALGFFVGATLPWAVAHPEGDCPPAPLCPACETCIDPLDADGDGIPDFLGCPDPESDPLMIPFVSVGPDIQEMSPRPPNQHAIQRALEAIEAVEEAEAAAEEGDY